MLETTESEDFSEPRYYHLEPALQPPPPRRVPDVFRESRYAKDQRQQIIVTALVGFLCSGMASLPFVQRIGVYFLPFEYLDWIGYLLLLASVGSFLAYRFSLGRFNYVVSGLPLVAKIRSLEKVPTLRTNGIDTKYAIVADILVRHPESKQVGRYLISSRDFPAEEKHKYDSKLKVGDYATAVYLPGAFETSLRLYGFLDIDPAADGLVHSGERPGLLTVLFQIMALAALFGVNIANLYAIKVFEPLEVDWLSLLLPAVLIGAAITSAGLLVSYRRYKKGFERTIERNRVAYESGGTVEQMSSLWQRTDVGSLALKLILFLGLVLLVAVTGVCGLFAVNALCDTSSPRLESVEIRALEQKTNKLILRNYEVHFVSPRTGKVLEHATTPEVLTSFVVNGAVVQHGVLELRDGFFGWPWITAIKPKQKGS